MGTIIRLLVFCPIFVCLAREPQTKPVSPGKEPPPETRTVPLKMKVADLKRTGRFLMGRIVDKDGKYLVGALVKAVGRKGAPPYSSVSRTNGQFHVIAPLGDRYRLVVTMTGYQTLRHQIDPDPEP